MSVLHITSNSLYWVDQSTARPIKGSTFQLFPFYIHSNTSYCQESLLFLSVVNNKYGFQKGIAILFTEKRGMKLSKQSIEIKRITGESTTQEFVRFRQQNRDHSDVRLSMFTRSLGARNILSSKSQ